jgi:hypothetical protein
VMHGGGDYLAPHCRESGNPTNGFPRRDKRNKRAGLAAGTVMRMSRVTFLNAARAS